MTHTHARYSQRLDELRQYLQGAGYAEHSVEHLCAASRQFLDYLHERGIALRRSGKSVLVCSGKRVQGSYVFVRRIPLGIRSLEGRKDA